MTKSEFPADDPSCEKFNKLPSGQRWYGANAYTSLLVNSWEKAEIKTPGRFSCNVIKLKETACFSERSAWNVHYYPARTACSGQLVPARSRVSVLGGVFIYRTIKEGDFLTYLSCKCTFEKYLIKTCIALAFFLSIFSKTGVFKVWHCGHPLRQNWDTPTPHVDGTFWVMSENIDSATWK